MRCVALGAGLVMVAIAGFLMLVLKVDTWVQRSLNRKET